MPPSRRNSLVGSTVSRNIRTARLRAGLTQSQLARQLNATDGMLVSKWERGIHRPSDDNLLALGALLGCDVAWFYTEHEAAA